MNAQNAQSIGYSDGERFFRLGMPEMKALPKDVLLESARSHVLSHGAKTRSLYLKGYEEAIDKYEREQAREREEAEKRAAIPHNPNTRFCSCVACKGE